MAGGENLAETLHHLALPEVCLRYFSAHLEHSCDSTFGAAPGTVGGWWVSTGAVRHCVASTVLWASISRGDFQSVQIDLLTWAAQRD